MKGFRVWSNYWNRYATEAELYIDVSVDTIFEDDDGVTHHENTDLVLEFGTGLKDKNGKEIYEGDILDDGEGHIGKVLYNERLASFAYEWGNCGSTFMDLYTSDMEVIGNIHENPELLDEENHPKSIKESEEKMSEPSLIEITDDKEFMERVLKKSEEMQEEVLKKAEEEEE